MESDSITLDWMFRYSLINDIVKVMTCECYHGNDDADITLSYDQQKQRQM